MFYDYAEQNYDSKFLSGDIGLKMSVGRGLGILHFFFVN